MAEQAEQVEMVMLEVHETVSGLPEFNRDTIAKLMASDDFSLLTAPLRRSVLGSFFPSPDDLVAEVEGSAILINRQWAVSVHGGSLENCLASLLKYRNAVATELGATVVGDLQIPVAANTGPLIEHVLRRQRRGCFRRRLKQWWLPIGLAILGPVLGVALTILWE